MALVFGGSGVTSTLRGQPSNSISLAAGNTFLIPPGTWMVGLGSVSTLQEFDTISGAWRTCSAQLGDGVAWVDSDGNNYRIANLSGCVVGALLTNGGSGFTSAPVATASSGTAVFSCVMGPCLSTTVTITNAGTNYTYPPIVQIQAPPPGGIQATGHATLSGSTVGSVVIDNQGAGYSAGAPTITLLNDPRELTPQGSNFTGVSAVTTGVNAAASAALIASGSVCGIVVLDHGKPLTSVPTIAFAGGGGSGAAATSIMFWTVTSFTLGSAGSGYTGAVEISFIGGFPTTAASFVNPQTQSGLVPIRKASIIPGPLVTGQLSTTGQSVIDGGIYSGTPLGIVYGAQAGTPLTPANASPVLGGITDTSYLFPA